MTQHKSIWLKDFLQGLHKKFLISYLHKTLKYLGIINVLSFVFKVAWTSFRLPSYHRACLTNLSIYISILVRMEEASKRKKFRFTWLNHAIFFDSHKNQLLNVIQLNPIIITWTFEFHFSCCFLICIYTYRVLI